VKEKIRVIPRIEIKNNNLIKGVQYEGLRIIGDPYKYSKKYYEEGADQIIVMDIVASLYSRDNLFSTIDKLTKDIFIPITAGGGVKAIEDIKKLLSVGADRISINSHLFENPNLIEEVLNIFGSQFLTIVIEAKKIGNEYYCMKNHGRDNSGITVEKWIKYLKNKKFGELAIFSVDKDGMNNGPDEKLLEIVHKEKILVPLIYGGGLHEVENIGNIINKYELSGISLSSSLHFNKLNIDNLKKNLLKKGININET